MRIAEDRGVGLADLTDEELTTAHPALTAEVREVLTVEGSVASRAVRGGTAPTLVAAQLGSVRDLADRLRAALTAPPSRVG